MLIFQMTSGGTTARANTMTPTTSVTSCEPRAMPRSEGCLPRCSHECRYTSLMMADDEAMSSDDTVEMDAAMGPMMATPASQAGSVCAMACGMMLSTLAP